MSTEPQWLRGDTVLAIHDAILAEHGGSSGIRDAGLLESALAAARQRFAYGETDLFALAPACVHGIVRNHPFIDGDKRTAFMAGYTFLGVNGWSFEAPEGSVVEMVEGLVVRAVTEESFAQWMRESSVARSAPPARKKKRGAKAPKRSPRGRRE